MCRDSVRQLSHSSHEMSYRDSSPPGSTASAQINHGWLQRRTKRPFQALLMSRDPSELPSFPPLDAVCKSFGSLVDAKKGDALASESTVCAAGTKERRQSHCARSAERYYVIGK